MAFMSDMGRPALAIPQCRQCGSVDVHAIKMFCLSTDQVGTGAVLGTVSGGHIGVGLTTTTAQTSLSLSFKPGREPSKAIAGNGYLIRMGLVALAAFIGGGIADALGSDSAFGIAATILIVGMIGNVLVNRSKMKENALEARKAWEAKKHLYEHGWVCVRCGHTWIP